MFENDRKMSEKVFIGVELFATKVFSAKLKNE